MELYQQTKLPSFLWFINNLINLSTQHLFLFMSVFTIAVGPVLDLPLNLNQWIILAWLCYQALFTRDKANIRIQLGIIIFSYFSFIIYNQYFDWEMLKKFFGIAILSITFYKYVYHYRNKLQEIFAVFLYISIIISFIAIIQQIGWVLKIPWMYDFHYLGIKNYIHTIGPIIRSTSIASEPAHLGYMLVPAFFIAFGSILSNKMPFYMSFFKRWVVVIAMLVSFSLIGYFSMLVCVLYLFKYVKTDTLKKLYISLFLFPIIVITTASNFGNVAYRISNMINRSFEVNSSTLSQWGLISNSYVAFSSLINNPLGTGIQTHQYNYDKYFVDLSFLGTIRINEIDANSLILRMISEFGIIGISMIILFYFFFRIRNNKYFFELFFILNTSAFLFIYLYAFRNGAYLDPMLWLFISIASLTKKISNA
jgi:hypothetical protein